MTDDQRDLFRWLREFDYSLTFFADPKRTPATVISKLLERSSYTDTKHDVKELLLAYREHAQELLRSIQELEKIVG